MVSNIKTHKHTLRVVLLVVILATALAMPSRAQFYSVKLNLPALLTGTINPGFGVSLNKKTSLDFSLAINPVKTKQFAVQFAALQPGARFWFSQVNYAHFMGTHLTAAIYNVGNDKFAYRGFTLGVGISYGYSWAIKKRLGLTAEVGVGAFYMSDSRQNYYTPETEDIYIYHNKRIAVAPSKIALTLVYLF